jgi:predicted NBD/HSP70 family sugar kinase
VKRTTSDLRRHNRSILLCGLYLRGPTSRRLLTRDSALSSATVSNVVAQLIAEGLVAEVGSEESDGGRPRSVLEVRPDFATVIGADIGETHISVGLFDWTLKALTSAQYETADTRPDPDAATELVVRGVSEVTRTAGIDPAELLGVGVGVPGAVRPDPRAPHRPLVHAPTLGWSGVPFADMLATRLPAPVHVDNRARTLGQAEMWHGVGKGVDRVVTALLGVGVGAALTPCVEERVAGVSPATVEWGHTVLRVDGAPCRCGSRGCLEAYVGAEAILDRYEAAAGSRPLEAAGTVARLAELAARAATDATARAVLDETGRYLGIGVGNLVNLLHPDLVVLSGWAGIAIGPAILPAVRRAAEEHALPYLRGHTRVETGRLGQDAVAMGAATLPVSRLLEAGGRRPTATRAAG